MHNPFASSYQVDRGTVFFWAENDSFFKRVDHTENYIFLANIGKGTFDKYNLNAKTVVNTEKSTLVCFNWSRLLEIFQT